MLHVGWLSKDCSSCAFTENKVKTTDGWLTLHSRALSERLIRRTEWLGAAARERETRFKVRGPTTGHGTKTTQYLV